METERHDAIFRDPFARKLAGERGEQIVNGMKQGRAGESFRFWLIDLASPRLMKIMDRSWGKSVKVGNAPFQFAPADGTAFFGKLGWRETQFRSAM